MVEDQWLSLLKSVTSTTCVISYECLRLRSYVRSYVKIVDIGEIRRNLSSEITNIYSFIYQNDYCYRTRDPLRAPHRGGQLSQKVPLKGVVDSFCSSKHNLL